MLHVHMNKAAQDSNDIQFTRFKFSTKRNETWDIQTKATYVEESIIYDEDGDLVIKKKNDDCDVIGIYHRMSTSLNLVGLQLWRGSLLMCDYAIHNAEMFRDKNILELGAGVGLTGILLGQYAASILCTDFNDGVIEMCKKNMQNNHRFFNSNSSFSCQKLDWFKWHKEELQALCPNGTDIIIACDCIYSDSLTDALFKTIYCLLKHCSSMGKMEAYLPLEKRLNFTLDDLEVTCHEYDYFRKCLDALAAKNLNVEIVEIDCLPQYFEYDRVQQLELWRIKCI
ncbi:unnamed protein product [Clavelina lepadiformis]|uniref:Methyltransferase-like protein 22 n=1 Tax=Clavelina lepadiformis TaxID=159417 RepID=A0ABP0H1M5_CLALP